MDQPAVPMKIRASIRPASSTFGSPIASASGFVGASPRIRFPARLSSRSCRRRAGALGWWDIDHYGQVADTILTDVTRKDGIVVVDDCVVLLVDGELCDVVDEDVTLSTVPVICTL